MKSAVTISIVRYVLYIVLPMTTFLKREYNKVLWRLSSTKLCGSQLNLLSYPRSYTIIDRERSLPMYASIL